MLKTKTITITFFSVLLSSIATFNISTFDSLFLLLTLPGLLFGIALTIPNIKIGNKENYTKIITILIYPSISVITFTLFFFFQMITPSISDKTPYFLVGGLGGIAISLTFDFQFKFKNKLTSFITIIVLSIASLLIADYLYPYPNDKQHNAGKLIAIWEILVAIGIITNKINISTQEDKE